MEGFTVALALLDYVPVAAFGAAMLLAGRGMNIPVFTVGAALSFLAGLMKASWKLVLGLTKKDIRWLDRPFVPMQATGSLIMLAGVVTRLFRGGFPGAAALIGMPQLIFFLLWLGFMGGMVWYKKNRFRREDAKCHWTAEVINSLGQCSLLLGVLFASGIL